MKRSVIAATVIAGTIILDQALKVWVKLNVEYGSGFKILGFDWAQIHFIENPGMAFGLEFGGVTGKLILSLFRIVMVTFLFFILRSLIRSKESKGLIICFALIIAGAMGNIIDSLFYGLLFSKSVYHGGLATFMPAEGGYAPFLQGKVVDMFYFPLIDTYWPDWVPYVGGGRLQFFRPVFNLADSAISVGVISILIFHRRFFKSKDKKGKNSVTVSESTSNTTDTIAPSELNQ